MVTRPWCKECVWWKADEEQIRGDRPQVGECHAAPPQMRRGWAEWPCTLPHDFCGTFRDKAA